MRMTLLLGAPGMQRNASRRRPLCSVPAAKALARCCCCSGKPSAVHSRWVIVVLRAPATPPCVACDISSAASRRQETQS